VVLHQQHMDDEGYSKWWHWLCK